MAINGRPQHTIQEELAIRRLNLRYDVIGRLALGVQYALPLVPVIWIAQAFAGKQTTLTVGISIAVTVTISGLLAASNASLRAKNREQRREIERLRRRMGQLEGRLGVFTDEEDP